MRNLKWKHVAELEIDRVLRMRPEQKSGRVALPGARGKLRNGMQRRRHGGGVDALRENRRERKKSPLEI